MVTATKHRSIFFGLYFYYFRLNQHTLSSYDVAQMTCLQTAFFVLIIGQ